MQRSSVTHRSRAALVMLALVGVLSGCGGGSSPSGSVECREPVDGVVTITAANLVFDTACLRLPADHAITIRLVNDDAEPHNIAIYSDSSKGTQLYSGEIIDGGESIDYDDIDPLSAGTYFFDCTVHPGMSGSVVVE